MKSKRIISVIISVFIVSFSLSFAALAEGPGGQPPEGAPPGGGGGADTMTYDYTGSLSGAVTANGEDISSDGETVSSFTADENALLVQNGGTLTVTQATVTKSGDDNDGDNCNFYGINSIALSVGEGSHLMLSDSSLKATGVGSNGVFATDSGTAYVYNVEIDTDADNSRGLDATYSGTIVADSVTISTDGDHCAALATDRGGGSVSVTNSEFSTAGSGSPLIYSTGDIEIDGVTGTSTGSQIAGMEGLNTILIYNSDLTSTLTTSTGSDPIADGVIIYQSTSGDAEAATGDAATFQAVSSKLTSAIASGAMFYVTNTTANVLLKDTEVNFDSSAAKLFVISGNDSNNWGSAGSNGGTVVFTALGETLSGDIEVDTISSLDMYLLDGTVYSGAAEIVQNEAGNTTEDSGISVSVDSSSKWVVTSDTTVTNLYLEDGSSLVDENGNTVSVTAGGETVVSGTSSVTVTVTGTYATSFELTEANEVSESFIDRTAFDETYGTSTAFSTNGDAETDDTTEETEAETEEALPVETENEEIVETAPAADDIEETENPSGNSKTAIIIVAACALLAAVVAAAYIAKKKKG